MPSRRIRELFWWMGRFEDDLANGRWRATVALIAFAAPARAMLYVSLGLYWLAERIAGCRASGGN